MMKGVGDCWWIVRMVGVNGYVVCWCGIWLLCVIVDGLGVDWCLWVLCWCGCCG